MAAVKKRLGFMPCPCCGHSVAVRETEAGTLTLACDGCDLSAYAKPGTDAANKWRAAIPGELPKAASQEPASAPPAPVAVPPKKVAAGPFDFLTAGAK